jgi:hypothetical protein
MRTIAFYLPQFHTIPENDEWWGKGFTEWVNVKKAEPLFEGHYQPRVPQNENYYNLLDPKVMEWQVGLAKEHGLYGFCFYHYWFGGHKLLEKPVEQYLENEKNDLPFCICWANEDWTNAWVSEQKKVLIHQEYGREAEWKEHFDYLLPFFKDQRYIKNDGKPLVVIYRAEIIDCLNEMLDYWQELAKENGFPGLDFAYQHIAFSLDKNRDESRFTYHIEYQPAYALQDMNKKGYTVLRDLKANILKRMDKRAEKIKKAGKDGAFAKMYLSLWEKLRDFHPQGLTKQSYDDVWQAALNHCPEDEKCVPGAFVDWDNTPRHHEKGRVFVGATPEKFEKYMTEQIRRTKEVYKKDMLFLFAWNEWAEGGYMEPDEKFGTGYLQALRNALIANGEM